MPDPFQVLGISPAADTEEIRRRYLELVRQSPPDRDPDRFAEVCAAYDEVNDPVARLQRLLFQPELEDIDSVIAAAQPQVGETRIPTERLLSLGNH